MHNCSHVCKKKSLRITLSILISLIRNQNHSFVCKNVFIKPQHNLTIFTGEIGERGVFKIPIAHAEGCYFADEVTLQEIVSNKQIIFKYCDENGEINKQANPNGSLNNIAGIFNKNKNILGMMPHPERMADKVCSSDKGLPLFLSLMN